MSIAIVVPTIRPECYEKFRKDWMNLVIAHKAVLLAVHDGKEPFVAFGDRQYTAKDILGKDADLIYNFNDGVRNLGFAFIARYLKDILKDIDVIMSFDDDCFSIGDTIQDHLDALNKRVPISWLATATEYTRGFPYGVRNEAEVVLSHGVWGGIKDYDAPTHLAVGNKDCQFYKGPIPKGVYFPMCGMNLAFKRKLLPYMYFAPMGPKVGIDRFADIWAGIMVKKAIDENGWAVVSGYAKVLHQQASNVFKNLQKEARGIELNEGFWQGKEEDDYFKLYKDCRERWFKTISKEI